MYVVCSHVVLQDMYEKMVQIDPNAPTEEEHRLKGVTKPRLVPLHVCFDNDCFVGQEDTKMGTCGLYSEFNNLILKMETLCSYKILEQEHYSIKSGDFRHLEVIQN